MIQAKGLFVALLNTSTISAMPEPPDLAHCLDLECLVILAQNSAWISQLSQTILLPLTSCPIFITDHHPLFLCATKFKFYVYSDIIQGKIANIIIITNASICYAIPEKFQAFGKILVIS